MASCKLQNYTEWLKEELGIIYQHCSKACSKQITSTTLGWIAILSEKTHILRFDFNCAHVIVWIYWARKKKSKVLNGISQWQSSF